MLRKFFQGRRGKRPAAMLIILLAGNAIPTFAGHAAETGLLHLRCTNPVSGANWAIVVDLDRGLVDTLPAKISDSWVSWRNPGGGIYELERATGSLQLRAASSTGGYFLHYTCKSE